MLEMSMILTLRELFIKMSEKASNDTVIQFCAVLVLLFALYIIEKVIMFKTK
jgi:uncharacterized membrane protein (DUF373 family)